jgi:hypothetical protein
MTFALTTPITGQAQTGLTTPTYTIAADTPPDTNSKQWAVTALGGTQTGVTTHTVAAPFTIAMFRPKVSQALSPVDPVTGVLKRVPYNTYKVITRKGVLPLAGQAYKNLVVTTILEVPAGSDTADAANIRGALSAHFGALVQSSAGIGDTAVQGIL